MKLQQNVSDNMSMQRGFEVLRLEEQLQIQLTVGADDEQLVFRVEILQSLTSSAFCAQVFRQDLFEVKPLDSRALELPEGAAHHQLWVKDDFFSGKDFSASSLEEVKMQVVESIRSTFQ